MPPSASTRTKMEKYANSSKSKRSPTESMQRLERENDNSDLVFGSALVPVNSSTPYSDATQVSIFYFRINL